MNGKGSNKKRKGLVFIVFALLCGGLAFVWFHEPAKEAVIQKLSFLTGESEPAQENDLGIYDLSPIDEDGTKRVEQEETIDENDTWTICYYFIGSDLEDQEEDDLSEMTKLLTGEISDENKENSEKERMSLLYQYAGELQEKGLDFPEYLYEPVHPVSSSENVTEDVIVSDREGAASEDIAEICNGLDSDKINIVIQTGGAKRWSNSLINPNKTQRFTVENGRLKEVENMPLKDSCDPDTLADFLNYCDENYYLIFSYDKDKNTVSLTGASIYNVDTSADASAAHVIGRTIISLQEGDVIRPVYKAYALTTNTESRQESDQEIVFSSSCGASMESLPDGNYLNAIVLTDIRSDEYYSGVVEQTIENAAVSRQTISEDFVGSPY